jgi:AcrR family transcriptional regulator
MAKVDSVRDDTTPDRCEADPRMAGLLAFLRHRKQSSHEKLLAAAIKLFCKDGYAAVTIEDITAEAGVSRVTYYRHFSSKSAIALELFQQAAAQGAPRMLAIGSLDFRDRSTVVQWLTDFFVADRGMRGILGVLNQVNVEDIGFSQSVQPFITEMIAALGRVIPAFAVGPDKDQRRWVKAWLLIYTILDQSNHAATRSGVSTNPMMIEVLADNFLDFVRGSADDQ